MHAHSVDAREPMSRWPRPLHAPVSTRNALYVATHVAESCSNGWRTPAHGDDGVSLVCATFSAPPWVFIRHMSVM